MRLKDGSKIEVLHPSQKTSALIVLTRAIKKIQEINADLKNANIDYLQHQNYGFTENKHAQPKAHQAQADIRIAMKLLEDAKQDLYDAIRKTADLITNDMLGDGDEDDRLDTLVELLLEQADASPQNDHTLGIKKIISAHYTIPEKSNE